MGEDIFGLVEPVQGQIGAGLPEFGLVYHLRQPGEMARNIEES